MISWNADSWFLCLTLTANNQTLTATKDFKTKWPESNSASDTDKTWSASDTDIHWQNLKWHWRLNLQWSIAKGWDHDTVCRSATASAQNVFEHRGPWQIWMIKSNSIKHNIWFWGSSLAERLTDMIEEVNRSIVVDLHRAWRWQTKNGMRIAEPKPDTDFAHCKQHLTQFTDTHTHAFVWFIRVCQCQWQHDWRIARSDLGSSSSLTGRHGERTSPSQSPI